MLVGDFHSQASIIDNVDTQINTIPIDGSYPTGNQDLYFEDISLKKNDLYINSDGANITDLNSGKNVFTFLGNVEIISEIVIIKCDKAILEFEEIN